MSESDFLFGPRPVPQWPEGLEFLADVVEQDDDGADLGLDVQQGAQRRARPRRGRPFFASSPIVGITGPNGAGKTLVMVHDAICDLRDGRRVLSTVGIRFEDRDGSVYASEPIVSLSQLVHVRDCTVVLDEIASIFPSSTSASGLPAEVVVLLQTARHRGITIRWSAPAWLRAQKILREVTQVQCSVNPIGKRTRDLWPEPLFSAVTLWDARSGKVDATPERALRRRFLFPRRLLAWGAYDTHADVPVIGHPDTGGICLDCGGTRTRAKCSPERHASLTLPPPFEGVSLSQPSARAPVA